MKCPPLTGTLTGRFLPQALPRQELSPKPSTASCVEISGLDLSLVELRVLSSLPAAVQRTLLSQLSTGAASPAPSSPGGG